MLSWLLYTHDRCMDYANSPKVLLGDLVLCHVVMTRVTPRVLLTTRSRSVNGESGLARRRSDDGGRPPRPTDPKCSTASTSNNTYDIAGFFIFQPYGIGNWGLLQMLI